MQRLTPELADRLARIALGHVGREYPNKLDQVLAGPDDLRGPRELHPIFYGSFDWHSAVHSHWLLARLARRFPREPVAGEIAAWLDQAFTEAGVAGELAFLAHPAARGFERPYGWAWLLMLQAELEVHETDAGRRWAAALRPLARAFEARFLAWLPNATYPVRVGTHGSSAFALTLAHRYAPFAADAGFGEAMGEAARRWFHGDADVRPLEPGGSDFLSATLVTAVCMAESLPAHRFRAWFARYLPRLPEREPAALFTPAQVSDRSDGQIAHLDGLNLSRAWCWRRLAKLIPALAEPLQRTAEAHLDAALPHLSDDYMGEHWLASFALLALDD
ncbi:MAG TPA: DUF2891 domain-containing protein [Caulobacteraceae bacterium]|jgi:hypothetical protein|nr:DUF2891 domain-containing protein [Caulobacteraceae bacterium]